MATIPWFVSLYQESYDDRCSWAYTAQDIIVQSHVSAETMIRAIKGSSTKMLDSWHIFELTVSSIKHLEHAAYVVFSSSYSSRRWRLPHWHEPAVRTVILLFLLLDFN